MKKQALVTVSILTSVLLMTVIFGAARYETYRNPEKVIDELYKGIEVAQEAGEYNCCIEPACTMCYLGHWKFEEGTCYCDNAILQGDMDSVCPECKKGKETGLCVSL
jgi:hypothetical protein